MAIRTKAFDAADYLKSEEATVAFLEDFLEDCDPVLLAEALGAVARARGMASIARETGLNREALYRALGPKGNPEVGTVMKVLKAMNLRLSVQPIAPQTAAAE